jgi:uncharacterized protein
LVNWLVSSLNILTFLVMAGGLFGSLIPFVPGPLIIWLAGLGYGIIAGFGSLGWWMFGLMTLFMVAGSLIDNLLMGVGAKQGGASWISIGVGLVAGVLGTLLLPPWGGLVAAPLAVYVYEVYRQGSHAGAIQAIKGMAAGWGVSFLARFGFGLLMMVCWLIWVRLG